MSPSEINDEFFFIEEDRWVKANNTFSLKNVRYEVPVDLREKQIQVRFERLNPNRAVVYYKSLRLGEPRPVDFFSNDRHPNVNPNFNL